jgi:hypothetical protein
MPTLLSAGQLPPNRHDDLDNYDLSDDPFASPSPPSSTKKRKEPPSQGLGIDEEVSVQKRARAPIVKLDEDRYAMFFFNHTHHEKHVNNSRGKGYLGLLACPNYENEHAT